MERLAIHLLNIIDLIDELDEDGMISTEVVYGLLATILMSMNEEEHEGDEH